MRPVRSCVVDDHPIKTMVMARGVMVTLKRHPHGQINTFMRMSVPILKLARLVESGGMLMLLNGKLTQHALS